MLHTPILITTLFASVFLAVASPIAVPSDNANATVIDLEERANQVTHVGWGTWFHISSRGDCGNYDNDNDLIVAIPKSLYDANGGGNCNQWIEIIDMENGKTAHGKTRDSCLSCGPNDLGKPPLALLGVHIDLQNQLEPLSVDCFGSRGTLRPRVGALELIPPTANCSLWSSPLSITPHQLPIPLSTHHSRHQHTPPLR
ncbi:hypothetical protein Hypma_008374 [Hypsizygus marmoreus]|uniref:Uncharacterized protein n=1 Tax=Hypsizygus marmoreus TaxID=39966 RepID=A0A369JT40_HYPMA|nr:hypothetical protein Hypma_008374 [Hypsizygus marmoreus]